MTTEMSKSAMIVYIDTDVPNIFKRQNLFVLETMWKIESQSVLPVLREENIML